MWANIPSLQIQLNLTTKYSPTGRYLSPSGREEKKIVTLFKKKNNTFLLVFLEPCSTPLKTPFQKYLKLSSRNYSQTGGSEAEKINWIILLYEEQSDMDERE